MKIFPLSLFHKTLAAMLAILLPILIVFLYGYQRNKEFLKRNILNSVSAIAEAYEGQVFQFLEMSRRRAEDFSTGRKMNKPLACSTNRRSRSRIHPWPERTAWQRSCSTACFT